MSNRRLSLYEFKNWLSGQKDLNNFFSIGLDKEDPYEKFIGRTVKSKVSEQKIRERIETEDDHDVVVNEFMDNGGSILLIEGMKIVIEVDSGTFTLPRFCVRMSKED